MDIDDLYEEKEEENDEYEVEDEEQDEEEEFNSIDDEEEYAEDDLSDLTILNEDELEEGNLS